MSVVFPIWRLNFTQEAQHGNTFKAQRHIGTEKRRHTEMRTVFHVLQVLVSISAGVAYGTWCNLVGGARVLGATAIC